MFKFDYVMAKYMNAKLKRAKILATGGDFCYTSAIPVKIKTQKIFIF